MTDASEPPIFGLDASGSGLDDAVQEVMQKTEFAIRGIAKAMDTAEAREAVDFLTYGSMVDAHNAAVSGAISICRVTDGAIKEAIWDAIWDAVYGVTDDVR
jgi:hypothetical protein